MLKRLILGLMFLGFISAAFAADVYTGTWKLNVAKSKFSPGPAPKVVNVLITEKGTDLAVSATGTAWRRQAHRHEVHLPDERRAHHLRRWRTADRRQGDPQATQPEHDRRRVIA